MENNVSRRSFIAGAGALAAGLSVAGISAASAFAAESTSASGSAAGSSAGSSAGSAAGSAAGSSAGSTAASAMGSTAGSMPASGSGSAMGSAAPAAAPTDYTSEVEAAASSWLGTAPQIADGDITSTDECDVLVVGLGTAGMFAACTAAENGAKVIAIEKNGAGTGIRGTLGAVGTKWQKDNGTEIDPVEICNDIVKYSASAINPLLTRLWADESAETIEWYGDLCVAAGRDFVIDSDNDLPEEEKTGVYRHWCTGHAAVKDGKTAEDSTVLSDYGTSLGVDFRCGVAMVELVKDGDRVSGAIVTDEDGNYVKIAASKGVIVCTGGYANNMDMMEALQHDTLDYFSFNTAMPGATGDGIKACLWAGADFDRTHTSMLFDRCALAPDQLSGKQIVATMFWMGSQPWLKVNLNGERFVNESNPYDFVLHAAGSQPGHTYCTIFDSNWTDYVYQFKTQGCSRMFPFENGAPVSAMTLEAVQGMNQAMLQSGVLQQADTLEELADKLGIPSDTFSATVEHYNELVAAGADTDFGKLAFRLSPLDTPPYFGVRQSGQLLCTMDGIVIDANMNALDPDGSPIEGLYVGGNDSGSFFSHSYPDLVPGLAAGRSATFGRRAGRIAATA